MLMTGFPTREIPIAHVQGPALQGMFLHLLESVDPGVARRLHDDNRYRPYTLSPLGVGKIPTLPLKRGAHGFQGFWLPKDETVKRERPCYIRITLLEDQLFPVFSRYFLSRAEPTFHLGKTPFVVTNVMVTQGADNSWSTYEQYPDLIEHASKQRGRKISLYFLTPTSFRRGNVDCPVRHITAHENCVLNTPGEFTKSPLRPPPNRRGKALKGQELGGKAA